MSMSGLDNKEVFTRILNNKTWGHSESLSGSGSSLKNTRNIIQELPKLLAHYKIRRMTDIPCGDFNWMKEVNLTGVDYIGGDIVDALIEKNRNIERNGIKFDIIDLLNDKLPDVDLILTRDCLVHLSYEDIITAIRNIMRSDATWLLTTTFPGREKNIDILTGKWRPLNLEIAPFNFPPPERYIFEYCSEGGNRYRDKSLGLWKIEGIYI